MKMSGDGEQSRRGSQRDEIVVEWRMEPDFEADPGAFPGRMTVAPRWR